jgi:sec-independent protein translocase protein TatA
MGLGVFKLLLILIIVFVVFGAGKLPQVMGDIGKGIRSLKEGLQGDDPKKPEDPKQIAASETDKDKNA